MKWINHAIIGGSITAIFHPYAVPLAILGSTAPDWLESLAKTFGKPVRHRAETHYLIVWLIAAVFFFAVWDYKSLLFWFSVGGVLHVLADSLTISGVPFAPWSDKRFHLFGGRLRTGELGEYVVAGVCFVIAFWFNSQTSSGEFSPFFYNWGELYRDGLIDAFEWQQNRFRWF